MVCFDSPPQTPANSNRSIRNAHYCRGTSKRALRALRYPCQRRRRHWRPICVCVCFWASQNHSAPANEKFSGYGRIRIIWLFSLWAFLFSSCAHIQTGMLSSFLFLSLPLFARSLTVDCVWSVFDPHFHDCFVSSSQSRPDFHFLSFRLKMISLGFHSSVP